MGGLVKFSKGASVLFLVMVSVSWCSAVAASPTEASVVGTRQGDWAMYVGAPPSEEYEWIRISVLKIEGTVVDLQYHYDLRARFRAQATVHFPDDPHFVSIDVADGTGNSFFFLIPRNLSVGDPVPVARDHVPLKIEGVEQRRYAGAERTVVYASFSNMTISYAEFKTAGRYYWDKETGLLVERIAAVGDFDMTCQKLTGTSMWSLDLRYWIVDNYPIVMMLAFILGALSISTVILVRIRQKISYRVTHTNMGAALVAVGIALLVTSILSLTAFGQVISSLSLSFAPFFLVSGVLVYTGGWVALRKDKLVIDVGIFLVAGAIILSGMGAACATYREVGAVVPYIDETRTSASMFGHPLTAYTSYPVVFFYPYSWFSSMFFNVIVCLAAVGIFYKIGQRF
jgi:hypothetical protein